jgi:hypothetical protein
MLCVMTKLLSLSLVLSLFVAGCTSEESVVPPKPAAPAESAESAKGDAPAESAVLAKSDASKKVVGPITKEVAVREAKCGCSIEGVGHCGNYILVEGQYVPLIHPKLGKMEFCAHKAKGVKIKVAGMMKDGKYVASQWKLSK